MIDRVLREFREGGIKGVAKRAVYYIPNHILIYNNKKRQLEYGLSRGVGKERVVVSMTSFRPRFKNIHLCLKSILLQTFKPDRIVVWFGSDVKEDMLTQEMLDLKEYGVEYRFDENENLMPHKKYFYIMQEEPDSVVITVDDDAVYPSNTLESLMDMHKRYPNCVCARRVHRIKWNKDGSLKPYMNWTKECKTIRKPSNELIAVGVGGVLYPPHCMNEEVFNIKNIKKLCIGMDDIWLKYMEQLNGTKVVWVPSMFPHPPSLEGIASLNESNVSQGKNDLCLKAISEIYGNLRRT